ncbi:hypothetical protein GUJ93_ZPchr0006g41490 [Zizania palustris]|uniref:Uncharacterized protein n=1 Tax=Zizania palustris TaxID=103762 RepID=A0A8J5W3S1_ZIZPA|nr:hypothetical protein GUJ93_ZPchr0006g41490 [Zizania palustris]
MRRKGLALGAKSTPDWRLAPFRTLPLAVSTKTPGDGSRGKHLATEDNLGGVGLDYNASILSEGNPSGRSSCGLGREGPSGRSGVLDTIGGTGDNDVDNRNA